MSSSTCFKCYPWSQAPSLPFFQKPTSNFSIISFSSTQQNQTQFPLSHNFTPTQLLDTLRRQNDESSALRLFDWASKQPNFTPNLLIYEELLTKLGKLGSFDSMKHVLQQMKLSGCEIRRGNLDGALRMREQMVEADCPVTNVTVNVLEMKNKGCQPDEFTYNMLIDNLCLRGKLEEALALLKDMESSGCARNVITYNTLIDGFCKNKRIQEAEEIFDEMEIQGVSRNLVTYNTLIDGLCKSRRVEDAAQLMDQMIMEGLKPNKFTYNSMLTYFCRAGDIKKAADIVQTMTSNGCEPDIVTYGTLIGGLCKAGRVDVASRLLRTIQMKGMVLTPHAYNPVIQALFRRKRGDEAMRLYREMLENSEPPDAITYKIVFRGLCSGGGPIGEAVDFLVEMIEKGFLPEFSSFYMLAEGLSALAMEDTLIKLIDMVMKKANFSDSEVSMIRGFLKIRKFQDALALEAFSLCLLRLKLQAGSCPILTSLSWILSRFLGVLKESSEKLMAIESMDTHDEETPLVADISGSETPKSRTRDVHILSSAFLLVFLAYGAAQNLETTVNSEGNLGTVTLGILYVSFAFFSLFAKLVVLKLGSKNAVILGTTGYWLYIAANLKPTWYTMVPASVYLGFAASIIWVGEGTYLTSIARSHSLETKLHEATVIGKFNGEFWAMFALHQFVGNLITLAILNNGVEGNSSNTTLLFIVFLFSMTIGTILMCFIRKSDDNEEKVSADSSVSFFSVLASRLKSVVTPLLDKRMLLIIPLIAYSGLQQAFVWADYTKDVVNPILGESGVGGAMAVYGAFDAICSLAAGRLTSGLRSITLIVIGGAFFQAVIFLWLLLKYTATSGVLGIIYPLLMAALLGIGDGVLNTQLSALLALLFKQDTEGAFAQLKLWQSSAIAVVFFLSTAVTLQTMVLIMLVGILVSVVAFLYLTLKVEKAFS
ncbi:hypothetical protein COLO4_14849 [Corchorus olitorius]|uniref:Uncharacterized protein n=1 Tax=Corchorus olitorius TaxID=93759 RepID=A0A1R3JQS4_9ROSI|nr:hypothetical protein COLO4_14849 [Corchorus olitorius]